MFSSLWHTDKLGLGNLQAFQSAELIFHSFVQEYTKYSRDPFDGVCGFDRKGEQRPFRIQDSSAVDDFSGCVLGVGWLNAECFLFRGVDFKELREVEKERKKTCLLGPFLYFVLANFLLFKCGGNEDLLDLILKGFLVENFYGMGRTEIDIDP